MSVRWSSGGEARFVTVSATSVALESDTSAPPGARLEGELTFGSRARVRVKVHGSRWDGQKYAILGRPIDWPRAVREEVMQFVEAQRARGEV